MEAKKKLFSIEDIENMEIKVGETLITTAEFFAEIGKIENDKLPVIEENINKEIITDILSTNN